MEISNYIKTGTITLAFSYLFGSLIVPIVKNIFEKYQIYDFNDPRKQNKKLIVRMGGIAIFFSYLLSILFARFFFLPIHVSNFDQIIFSSILITSFLFFILGFFDDFFQLSPIKRLICQIAFSSINWLFFFKITNINLSLFSYDIANININNFFSLLFIIFWLVGITNAFNWLDGLDGLAAGISVLFSIAFLLHNMLANQLIPFYSSCALLGASLSFLKYNKYPAKIFMGDSGSNFLGINFAILSFFTFITNKSFSEINDITITNIGLNLVPSLLILLIPILDMCFVIIKRLIDKKKIFFPDRNHIHHRLLKKGLSERKVVNIIYFLVTISFLISFFGKPYLNFLSFGVTGFVLFKFCIKDNNLKYLSNLFKF